MSRPLASLLITAFVLAMPGCASLVLGEQELVSGCLDGECAACSSDADCKVASNPCESTAYCIHRDRSFAVSSLGCNAEHDVPPDSDCVCRAGACSVRE